MCHYSSELCMCVATQKCRTNLYLGLHRRTVCQSVTYHSWILHWLASSFFLNQRLRFTQNSYWTLKAGNVFKKLLVCHKCTGYLEESFQCKVWQKWNVETHIPLSANRLLHKAWTLPLHYIRQQCFIFPSTNTNCRQRFHNCEEFHSLSIIWSWQW
jgi:hypothetical protein